VFAVWDENSDTDVYVLETICGITGSYTELNVKL
jgi:hypothetical protein